jgi:hypothetical protein
MSAIPGVALVAGVICIVVIIAALVLYFARSRTVNLTRTASPDEKPVWMRTTPPSETIEATRADGKGITVFDHDPGEVVAAPFAEQIEDILSAKLRADPALSSFVVDLGTGPEGELKIVVNDKSYTDIEQIPDERLRQAFRQAVEEWDRRM